MTGKESGEKEEIWNWTIWKGSEKKINEISRKSVVSGAQWAAIQKFG